MNNDEKGDAIVMVFYRPDRDEVLLEERGPENHFAGKLIFPGGSVEENERINKLRAVQREAREEFDVRPTRILRLRMGNHFMGETGKRLWPYLIRSWDGTIPDRVIDKGNPLVWISLENAEKIYVESSRKIVSAVRLCLINL